MTGDENFGAIYRLRFASTTEGQILTVSWILLIPASGATEGNVGIYAAALAPATVRRPSPTSRSTRRPQPSSLPRQAPSVSGVVTATVSTTEVNAPGTVALSAVVTPSHPEITASLTPSSVAAGSNATLRSRPGRAHPAGLYTVTVTGTEGAVSHGAPVAVDVVIKTNTPYLLPAAPVSGGTHIEGVLGGQPNTTFDVQVRDLGHVRR